MFYSIKKRVFLGFVVFCTLMSIGAVCAAEQVETRYPSKFAIPQQQGPTCFYIPFVNLKIIEANRVNNQGRINLEDFQYFTKIESYSWFFPQIRVLDHAYDRLREGNRDYATYEMKLRSEGIKSSHRYSEDGKHIEKFDVWPTDTARRLSYTPYNMKVEESPYCGMRWVPILHNKNDGYLYFYDHTSKSAVQLEVIPQGSGKYNSETDYFLTKYVNDESKFCYEFLSHIGVSKGKIPEIFIDKIPDSQCYRFNAEILDRIGFTAEELSTHRILPSPTPF